MLNIAFLDRNRRLFQYLYLCFSVLRLYSGDNSDVDNNNNKDSNDDDVMMMMMMMMMWVMIRITTVVINISIIKDILRRSFIPLIKATADMFSSFPFESSFQRLSQQ